MPGDAPGRHTPKRTTHRNYVRRGSVMFHAADFPRNALRLLRPTPGDLHQTAASPSPQPPRRHSLAREVFDQFVLVGGVPGLDLEDDLGHADGDVEFAPAVLHVADVHAVLGDEPEDAGQPP